MNQDRIFASKADPWFIGVSVAGAALALFLSWSAATDGYAWTDIPFCGVLILVSVILPAWMFAATRYTFRGDLLLIRSGPTFVRLPLADITAAAAVRAFAPAPALSNDRVRIDYRGKAGALKSVFISPRDREGFLAELSRRQLVESA